VRYLKGIDRKISLWVRKKENGIKVNEENGGGKREIQELPYRGNRREYLVIIFCFYCKLNKTVGGLICRCDP